MKDFFVTLLIIVAFVTVVVTVAIGLDALVGASGRRSCDKLAVAIGRDTKYVNGACRIEVCDGVWLEQNEVIYQLDLIQSCEPPTPKEQER